MKAIVQSRYGGPEVLELGEVDKPTVEDDTVLVRVHAASVNAADWHLLMMPLPMRLVARAGVRQPRRRIPGSDVAGVVEAVGKNVTEFRPGDEVFGGRAGSFAEYVAGRERNFAPKPARLTFEEAAAVPVAACTALQAVRDHGKVEPGQRVLVNGAGGGVGTFAVQIAKAFGAEVTATTSTDNVRLLRSIGADHVIDYTRQDFTKGGQRYEVILEVGGTPSLAACRRALTPDGRLVLVGAGNGLVRAMARPTAAVVRSRLLKQPVIAYLARLTKDDLLALKQLLEAGKVKPVIDRRYPLSETAEALRYLGTRRARGKVVITI